MRYTNLTLMNTLRFVRRRKKLLWNLFKKRRSSIRRRLFCALQILPNFRIKTSCFLKQLKQGNEAVWKIRTKTAMALRLRTSLSSQVVSINSSNRTPLFTTNHSNGRIGARAPSLRAVNPSTLVMLHLNTWWQMEVEERWVGRGRFPKSTAHSLTRLNRSVSFSSAYLKKITSAMMRVTPAT